MSKYEEYLEEVEEINIEKKMLDDDLEKALHSFNKEKEKFEKQVRNKFKDIDITLSHNEYGFKIKIGKTVILKHLYNDTSFENIKKSLFKNIYHCK